LSILDNGECYLAMTSVGDPEIGPLQFPNHADCDSFLSCDYKRFNTTDTRTAG
jgi:hypothetical protein